MQQSNYNEKETRFLVDGFQNGFDIGYEGSPHRRDTARNIPIRQVGSEEELWSKLMKEVTLGRYAGPFDEIPFDEFIQSPIGLVPKVGNKTRLIFHLSYDFNKEKGTSVNANTPKEKCSVKYHDLDEAIQICLCKLKTELKKENYDTTHVAKGKTKSSTKPLLFSKTDLSSAFRMVPLSPKVWRWLVMAAKDPKLGKTKYFFNKYLPFGASISCSHFQRFSNALKHLLEFRIGRKKFVINHQ